MSEKLVHVNAYTKDDGTKVKEHYRGGVEFETPLLTGGVSEDVYYPQDSQQKVSDKFSAAVQVVIAVAQMASEIAVEGIQAASAALNAVNEASAEQVGVELDNVVDKMRQVHSISVSTEQAMLEKLSNTTNQREYKELYDTYVQQRKTNRANGALINRIACSAEHKNYEDVVNGLNEYNSIQSRLCRM